MIKNINDFQKFARDKKVSSVSLDKFKKSSVSRFSPIASGTPMVIEERQLNISAISVFDRLMMDRIIFLGEEIDDYIANVINAQLLFLDTDGDNQDEPISLYINSPGGDCYSGLAIYDTVMAIKAPVHTFTMGLAASMAYILAISGEKKHRYALKHSRLMQHQPWQGGGGGQATDVEIQNTEIQSLKYDMIKIISKHTGQPEEKVKLDSERDYWMNSEKAKEYGAIDKILVKTR